MLRAILEKARITPRAKVFSSFISSERSGHHALPFVAFTTSIQARPPPAFHNAIFSVWTGADLNGFTFCHSLNGLMRSCLVKVSVYGFPKILLWVCLVLPVEVFMGIYSMWEFGDGYGCSFCIAKIVAFSKNLALMGGIIFSLL